MDGVADTVISRWSGGGDVKAMMLWRESCQQQETMALTSTVLGLIERKKRKGGGGSLRRRQENLESHGAWGGVLGNRGEGRGGR